MPFERSPDGLIKHIINEKMDTKECCLDIYMQFLPPGKASGKHRHLSEEVFYVVEGRGYDLHWDVRFDCKDVMEFEWDEEPKRFDWEQGDFVYIPPYCIHKHFNADAEQRGAHHRHQQPHHQADGLRLVRAAGERGGVLS